MEAGTKDAEVELSINYDSCLLPGEKSKDFWEGPLIGTLVAYGGFIWGLPRDIGVI